MEVDDLKNEKPTKEEIKKTVKDIMERIIVATKKDGWAECSKAISEEDQDCVESSEALHEFNKYIDAKHRHSTSCLAEKSFTYDAPYDE